MDKSFNDEELSDIMKEIEALEQDFKEDDVKSASPVMEELAQMSEKEAIPTSTHNVVQLESKRATPKTESKASTTMSFKVEGELNLALQFDIGGKSVALQVSEEGLTIQMEGGVTFTVPVAEKSSLKKAV